MAEVTKPPALEDRGKQPKQTKPWRDSNNWKWVLIRFLYWLGLFVLLSPILYFGPNWINYGKWTPFTTADLIPIVQRECVPVVIAVKKYHRETGHFPERREDLFPKYLFSLPWPFFDFDARGVYFYDPDPNLHQFIRYNLDPSAEGWEAVKGIVQGPIPLPPVMLPPTTQPASQTLSRP